MVANIHKQSINIRKEGEVYEPSFNTIPSKLWLA